MKNKLGITEGEWLLADCGRKIEVKVKNNNYSSIIFMTGKTRWQNDSKLIVDAGTTANKCQKLPSQLLAENEEMKEMLIRSQKEINHLKHIYKDVGHCGKYLNDLEQILNKIN